MKAAIHVLTIAIALTFAGTWNASTAHAQLTKIGMKSSFEGYWGSMGAADQWQPNGNAGIDVNLGQALSYQNNGWIQSTAGWNALFFTVQDGYIHSGAKWTCYMEAWIRSSGNVADFYFSAIDPLNGGAVWSETGPLANALLGTGQWIKLARTFNFTRSTSQTGYPGNLAVRIGFWGYGADTWVKVDDVALACNANSLQSSYPSTPAITYCTEYGCP